MAPPFYSHPMSTKGSVKSVVSGDPENDASAGTNAGASSGEETENSRGESAAERIRQLSLGKPWVEMGNAFSLESMTPKDWSQRVFPRIYGKRA